MTGRKRLRSNKIIFYNAYAIRTKEHAGVNEFAERHDELLNRLIILNENILELDKKIQSVIENNK
jgi:hypothetical protein